MLLNARTVYDRHMHDILISVSHVKVYGTPHGCMRLSAKTKYVKAPIKPKTPCVNLSHNNGMKGAENLVSAPVFCPRPGQPGQTQARSARPGPGQAKMACQTGSGWLSLWPTRITMIYRLKQKHCLFIHYFIHYFFHNF